MTLKSLYSCFKLYERIIISSARYKCLDFEKNYAFHSFHTFSRLLGFKPTFTQLRYLTNSVTVPQINVEEIRNFLKDNRFSFNEGPTCLHIHCPHCKETQSLTNPSMFVNMKTGNFICYSCKQAGSWQRFQDYITSLKSNISETKQKYNHLLEKNNVSLSDKERREVNEVLESATNISELSDKEVTAILKHFGCKGLKAAIVKSFNLKINADHSRLFFPFNGIDGQVTAVKILSKINDQFFQDLIIPRTVAALFGWSDISRNLEIVLTSTPLDAIAISQETNILAISIPKGLSSLPDEVLPLLEKFQKITIWFNADKEDEGIAKFIAEKLGKERCQFVWNETNHLSPLASLQNKENIFRLLKKAQPFLHKSIITSNSLRNQVFAELDNEEQVQGVQWKRFPALNKLLKGHRPGELTIFTGPTGSGKTTFISEYSLDLCMQGVCTLWGSFEINNKRLLKTMMTQFAQIPLKKFPEKYDYWADKFEELPLYFMTFHGQELLKNVIEAMIHAVKFYRTKHIIIDNIQFMLGTGNMNSSMDRFFRQDIMVSEFRQFATEHNCHITLVMHPRKEIEELSNHSIYGGAKASQEADNVMILQDKRTTMLRGRKYLQVTKNRYDGDLGIMPLDFDKDTLSFSVKRKNKSSSYDVQGNSSLKNTENDANSSIPYCEM